MASVRVSQPATPIAQPLAARPAAGRPAATTIFRNAVAVPAGERTGVSLEKRASNHGAAIWAALPFFQGQVQRIDAGAGLVLDLGEINVLGLVTLVHVFVHSASSLCPGRYAT